MAIGIRKPKEIDQLREVNQLAANTLHYMRQLVKPGATLKEIDALGEAFVREHGARPSFKGLYGFPASVCTSLNEVIIHGIPTDVQLKEGDILGLDIGIDKDGWYGDSAITIAVGEVSSEDEKLIACAKDSLEYAISIIYEGMRFKELSLALEQYIHEKGFHPLRGYCGHGIGKKPHEEPEIPNYFDGLNAKQGPKIKNGMVFCLEPMICQKTGESTVLSDKWSVVSKDGLKGSHYEHAVAIIDRKAEILSAVSA